MGSNKLLNFKVALTPSEMYFRERTEKEQRKNVSQEKELLHDTLGVKHPAYSFLERKENR